VFRLPAFLYYSGAAGGLSLALLLAGLTMLAVFLWLRQVRGVMPESFWLPDETRFRFDPLLMTLHFALLVFLYTYAYALTAVLLRHTILKFVPALYTWVLMIVLLALGSAVPLLVAAMWHQGRWRYDQHYYYLFANPFAALADFGGGPGGMTHQGDFHLFVAAWAALVTALNLPWFIRQVRRFRPYLPREAMPPRVVQVPIAAAAAASSNGQDGA
jgi:hypothetical protein